LTNELLAGGDHSAIWPTESHGHSKRLRFHGDYVRIAGRLHNSQRHRFRDRNDQQRTILTLRNSSTSAGVLFIGLGFPPVDASTALFELPAGGQLVFDVAVPQDEVWLFSTAGSLGMVGYALGGMRLFKDQAEPGAGLMPKVTLVARSGPFA